MGANSKQGWYLFLFIIGFTFLIGRVGLSWASLHSGRIGLLDWVPSRILSHQAARARDGPRAFSGASREFAQTRPSRRITLNRFSESKGESQ